MSSGPTALAASCVGERSDTERPTEDAATDSRAREVRRRARPGRCRPASGAKMAPKTTGKKASIWGPEIRRDTERYGR
jgi:hypothetical protein